MYIAAPSQCLPSHLIPVSPSCVQLTSEQVAQLQSVLGPEPCVDELASIEEIERGLERLRTGSDECLQQAELCQGMVRTGFEKAQLRRYGHIPRAGHQLNFHT